MKTSLKRREFLRTSAAGAAGISLLSPLACSTGTTIGKGPAVGLQLYSIRDAMAADTPGSLKKVADMGYRNMELADYANGKFYGYAPAEFRKMVEDLGMVCLSSHTRVEDSGVTMDNAKIMAEAHAELGVKYLVQPWVNEEDRNIERYKRMIADWNQVAGVCKEMGIQFGYHNHNFEFANLDGVVPYYDLFLKEMDPELITMEIDLYWVTKAGQDPVDMFKKYPGRFQLFHLKDMYEESGAYFDVLKDDIAPVGEGKIDFKRILAAKELAGMKHFFVEDDNQGNGKPFQGIEASITNIREEILA